MTPSVAVDSDRESRARVSIHRMFGEQCDPATDARLAANSIFLALGMDGPIKSAAERLLSGFSAALIAQKHHPQLREPLTEYVGELRALTLARHASFWVFLIQAFAVPGAVDEELAAYSAEFGPKLDYSMANIITGQFRQTASGDELLGWGGALSLLGHFWFPARDRGVAEADLLRVLWASPQRWPDKSSRA